MPQNLSQKLINSHLVDRGVTEGTPITLKFDRTLTQDATGTFREAPACRHAPLCVLFDRRHVSYRPSGSWARPRLRSRANGPRLFCSGCPNSVGPRVAMSQSSIAGQRVAASATPRSPRSSSGSKLMSLSRPEYQQSSRQSRQHRSSRSFLGGLERAHGRTQVLKRNSDLVSGDMIARMSCRWSATTFVMRFGAHWARPRPAARASAFFRGLVFSLFLGGLFGQS
jgi:hypothetical protein